MYQIPPFITNGIKNISKHPDEENHSKNQWILSGWFSNHLIPNHRITSLTFCFYNKIIPGNSLSCQFFAKNIFRCILNYKNIYCFFTINCISPPIIMKMSWKILFHFLTTKCEIKPKGTTGIGEIHAYEEKPRFQTLVYKERQ